ncbi:MAG: glycosyltransferase, partial [Desulfovibrio sp.]|nr:glycosyltransferase [Desulfovibrio sp.]
PSILLKYILQSIQYIHDYGLIFFWKKLKDKANYLQKCNINKQFNIHNLPVLIRQPLTKNLTIPLFDNIKVSIIIPVYNNYDITIDCINSIIHNTQDVPYEVILADDNSTDMTRCIENVVSNIVVIRNFGERGFLNNCNNASKNTQGEYILLLNNDTCVTPGWLSNLMDIMSSDTSVGMVGPKFLARDGTILEAGGCVFRDASAINYGRGSHPDLPEMNYRKEVDYISGACILLRTALWKELGGFDTAFAPCYYEDTDLAFRIRYEKSLKVVYQPKSVVYHLEGQSNGTDVEHGMKRFQIRNRHIFYQKWRNKLHYYHARGSDQLFLAKDHSFKKPTILIIDYCVLTFDQDTGSRSTFEYLQYFVKKGFNVKFFTEDIYVKKEYFQAQYDIGVEIIAARNLKKWLSLYGQYINYVYINRLGIAGKYIPILRSHTTAVIIYQGHDLHHIREYRQDILKGIKNADAKMQRRKAFELGVCEQADVACYFSDKEVDYVNRESYANAVQIPLYILDSRKMDAWEYTAETRKDIFFVGGYNHVPNVDAVQWFAQKIFPEVVRAFPDLKFYVVGSNPPPEIKALESENIIVTGKISDDELRKMYANIKLVVVPLRYGAGVKGKIIEAMYYKVPVLTTSIGIEGIDNSSGAITVADSENEMAQALIALYNNSSELNAKSRLTVQAIGENFSEAAVEKALSRYIPEILR